MSGAIRTANSLLRATGGRTVLLRIPAAAINGDPGEQLGLAQPQFQDVALRPAVFRRTRPQTGTADKPVETTCELLLSASTVAQLLASLGFQAAELLFAQAAGVLVDQSLLGITSVTTAEAFGTVYLYRLGLRRAVNELL